ncbi:MAG: tetratricopeptide repeat protein [Archangium sp.]
MDLMPLLTEAERYFSEKDIDRAAALFVHANKVCNGSHPLPMVGLARIAIVTRRFTDASAILDDVLTRFPRCAEALTARGVIIEAEGHLEDAMDWHSRALMVDPTLSTAHYNLGRCHGLRERWDLAAASLTLAIQHGATGPAVKLALGTALFKAKRTSEAIKVMTLTVNAHPNHVEAILALSDALVETGALGLAAQLLDNAKPRLPNVAVIASRRAAVALLLKDLEAASREAWRTTELAPKDEEAWLFAAVVDSMRLRFDTAEKALKTVLRLNPENWRAHYHLGGLSDAIKDKQHAMKCYRAAMAANAHAWEPLNNLAIMLLETGTKKAAEEAKLLLERAIRLGIGPDAVVTHYNLSLAYLKLGELAAVRRTAQHLLKVAPPEHPMATEAARLLRAA